MAKRRHQRFPKFTLLKVGQDEQMSPRVVVDNEEPSQIWRMRILANLICVGTSNSVSQGGVQRGRSTTSFRSLSLVLQRIFVKHYQLYKSLWVSSWSSSLLFGTVGSSRCLILFFFLLFFVESIAPMWRRKLYTGKRYGIQKGSIKQIN